MTYMSVLRVTRMGHPVLRQRARALEENEIRSAEVQKLIDDMFETMHIARGIGLHGTAHIVSAGARAGDAAGFTGDVVSNRLAAAA